MHPEAVSLVITARLHQARRRRILRDLRHLKASAPTALSPARACASVMSVHRAGRLARFHANACTGGAPRRHLNASAPTPSVLMVTVASTAPPMS